MQSKLLLIASLAAATFAPCAALHASDLVVNGVTVSGFLSQGYLYSPDNNYPTADKGGTWDFREEAVNASTTLGDHTRVGAQAFAQRFGALGGDQVTLDWAVVDYNVRQELGFRVGRVKYPKGLYGEALDLDFTRPFVLLPTAVYNPVLRDFSAAFNGGMVYGTVDALKGSFDYKAFFGYIPTGPSRGVAEFYNNSGLYAPGGLTGIAMEHVAGGQLFYNTPVDGLKFGYSFSAYHDLTSDGTFVGAPVDLHSTLQRFTWNTLSAEYQFKDWTFASEWQRTGGTNLSGTTYPFIGYTLNDQVGWDAWYVSVARHFARKFEAGAYYSSIHDRYPGVGSNPSNYRHDVVGSLRYELNEHVAFKIEAQSIQGTYEIFNTTRIPNPAPSNHTTVYAAKTTLSF